MAHRWHFWVFAILFGGTGVIGSDVESDFGTGQKTWIYCESGITWKKTLMRADSNVEVIVVQAPLFSTNPIIGQKMRYFNMYHSALIFVQQDHSGKRYFSLEFDSHEPTVNATLPDIKDGKLHWHTDARWCLTVDSEPLWGRGHWTETWSTVANLTVDEVDRIFNEVVIPMNGTGPGTGTQYQPWKVAPTITNSSISVQAFTCGDGIASVLQFIASTLKGAPPEAIDDFRLTTAIPKSYNLTPVPADDPEMVEYYRQAIAMIWGADMEGSRISLARRFLAFLHVFPMRYVYDANSRAYYKVSWGRLGVLEALPLFIKFRFDPRITAQALKTTALEQREAPGHSEQAARTLVQLLAQSPELEELSLDTGFSRVEVASRDTESLVQLRAFASRTLAALTSPSL